MTMKGSLKKRVFFVALGRIVEERLFFYLKICFNTLVVSLPGALNKGLGYIRVFDVTVTGYIKVWRNDYIQRGFYAAL